jgi:hypothetical protein
MKRFVEGEDRRQGVLLPEFLDDYVGEDNPVPSAAGASRAWGELQRRHIAAGGGGWLMGAPRPAS